jgi:NADH dehydrogenase/NADH:ubiquinone oxidoreductase subunit G
MKCVQACPTGALTAADASAATENIRKLISCIISNKA